MENCNNVPKVPFDPGWNDPPTFSYNAQQTTPNRPRNFLNKRVAFPLSGSSAAAPGLVPPVNLPPMPSIPAGPHTQTSISVPPTQSSTKVDNSVPADDLNIDCGKSLTEVKSILLEFLESSTELGPKANDIKRRIGVMEEMWTSGKLNSQIHLQMNLLACALRDDKPSTADEIHRSLMVDYVSTVGSWMPAIKQLIHHCIARSELLAIDKE